MARGIAVVTGLYLVLELLTYLPALGSPELAETTGPPPLLLGFVWALLGYDCWPGVRSASRQPPPARPDAQQAATESGDKIVKVEIFSEGHGPDWRQAGQGR